MQGAQAFSSGGAGPVLGHLLMGLHRRGRRRGRHRLAGRDRARPGVRHRRCGRSSAAWPSSSFGFGAEESAGTRALFLLGGLVSVAFGVVLFARPGVGAVTLALLYGLFAIIYGVTQITAGVQLRSAGRDTRNGPAPRRLNLIRAMADAQASVSTARRSTIATAGQLARKLNASADASRARPGRRKSPARDHRRRRAVRIAG